MASCFDERRTAEAAAYLLHKAGGTLPRLSLMKLLYIAERSTFQRYGVPLTGDRLVSMNQGPVLSRTLDLFNGESVASLGIWDAWIEDRANHLIGLRDTAAIRSPDELLGLSDGDVEILDEVWGQFGKMDRWELVRYTHKNFQEWEHPDGSSVDIPYQRLFRAVGMSHDDAEALVERLQEQADLNEQFK